MALVSPLFRLQLPLPALSGYEIWRRYIFLLRLMAFVFFLASFYFSSSAHSSYSSVSVAVRRIVCHKNCAKKGAMPRQDSATPRRTVEKWMLP